MLTGMAEAKLSTAARAFRAAHTVVAGGFLVAIVYVRWCALTGRRDGWLRVAVAALVTEGAFVAANRGDCPIGGLQERLGGLRAVTAAGMLVLWYRTLSRR
jgi:hypothetical protein